MDYIQRYSLSVGTLINRLLTYPFRSRRLYLILIACFKPMEALHKAFTDWARERIFETKVQFQVMPMLWLLKRDLSSYFRNSDDDFQIDIFIHRKYDWCCYSFNDGKDTVAVYSINDTTPDSQADIHGIYSITGRTSNRFNILAPVLKNPPEGKTAKEYEAEYKTAIRKIIAKYTLITNYDIIIQIP